MLLRDSVRDSLTLGARTCLSMARESGSFVDRTAPEACQAERRRDVVGRVDSDVGSGRDDLVDLVQDVVGENDFGAREQIVELFHGPWAENRRGHPGMRHRESHPTGEILASVPLAGAEDVNAGFEAAAAAFPGMAPYSARKTASSRCLS